MVVRRDGTLGGGSIRIWMDQHASFERRVLFLEILDVVGVFALSCTPSGYDAWGVLCGGIWTGLHELL